MHTVILIPHSNCAFKEAVARARNIRRFDAHNGFSGDPAPTFSKYALENGCLISSSAGYRLRVHNSLWYEFTG